MPKGRPKLLRIREITLDPEIYPRIATSWKTVYTYQEAMNAGSVFPPITVGKIDGFKGLYLVDGWHRWKATKQRGEKFIEAEVLRFPNKNEAYLEALRRNIKHGRQLSIYEKMRSVVKLEGMGFTREKISQIVKIPMKNIEKLMMRKVTMVRGVETVIKRTVEHLGPSAGEAIDRVQSGLHGLSQLDLLSDLLLLAENDLLDLDDPQVVELAGKVHAALGAKLDVGS